MEKNGLRGRRRKTDMQKKTDTEKGWRKTDRKKFVHREMEKDGKRQPGRMMNSIKRKDRQTEKTISEKTDSQTNRHISSTFIKQYRLYWIL